jgi:hypothetical protein
LNASKKERDKGHYKMAKKEKGLSGAYFTGMAEAVEAQAADDVFTFRLSAGRLTFSRTRKVNAAARGGRNGTAAIAIIPDHQRHQRNDAHGEDQRREVGQVHRMSAKMVVTAGI